jgi:thiol:disulfide interchange protein DsbD
VKVPSSHQPPAESAAPLQRRQATNFLSPQKPPLLDGRASPHPSYILSILLACFFAASPTASAQIGLKLQLVPEVTAIAPGQPFHVGLFLQHDPGSHTYWKFPGIVGVPTSIEWSLPPGFTAGPLEYPEPETTMMFQIRAQGYERDVLLQTRITPPANLRLGEKITLTGKATWMCCGRTCNPGTLPLSVTLPVAKKTAFDPQWRPLFEKERAAYSHPSSAWQASAIEDDKNVTLTLRPKSPDARPFENQAIPQELRFFTEDGWINSDEPQKASLDSAGNLTLVLRKSDVFTGGKPPAKLHGVIQRPGGWLAGGRLRSMNLSPPLMR